MAAKKISKMDKMDEGEAQVNFRYGLGIMQQNGDKEGLARAKKAHPELYADWERRVAGSTKAAPAAKVGAKAQDKAPAKPKPLAKAPTKKTGKK